MLSCEQFKKIGLTDIERVSAITGDNRILSFNKSVYKAIQAASGQDLLLFEDDVSFDGMFELPELPEHFMTLHLGCNIIGSDINRWKMPEYYNEKISILHNCWQSHATLYSKECIDFILKEFKFVTDEYEKDGCIIFDEWLRLNVLPIGRSYVMRPMVAYQRPRYSEIWNRQADYTGCHKQGNEYLLSLR